MKFSEPLPYLINIALRNMVYASETWPVRIEDICCIEIILWICNENLKNKFRSEDLRKRLNLNSIGGWSIYRLGDLDIITMLKA